MSETQPEIETPSGMVMETEMRGTRLYASAKTGNKQWIAVLTGIDEQYGFDRDFVAYQKPKTSKRADGSADLEPGAFVESVRYSHSGANNTRNYYRFTGDGFESVEKADVDAALREAEQRAARNRTDPEDVTGWPLGQRIKMGDLDRVLVEHYEDGVRFVDPDDYSRQFSFSNWLVAKKATEGNIVRRGVDDGGADE